MSAQLAAGRCNPGSAIVHSYGLRGVRVGEASHPGPQSTRIDSDDEPIFPGRFSPWCHCDSAEFVPIPATPPGAANDSTVASVDVQSGEEQDGFVSVVSPRRSRRGGGDRVTSTTVFPIQANQFAVFDTEIARNDRLEHESESDTLSVWGGGTRRVHVRVASSCLSSGTVATAIDSPAAMMRDSSVCDGRCSGDQLKQSQRQSTWSQRKRGSL